MPVAPGLYALACCLRWKTDCARSIPSWPMYRIRIYVNAGSYRKNYLGRCPAHGQWDHVRSAVQKKSILKNGLAWNFIDRDMPPALSLPGILLQRQNSFRDAFLAAPCVLLICSPKGRNAAFHPLNDGGWPSEVLSQMHPQPSHGHKSPKLFLTLGLSR
jgi:hypothetical protein